MYRCYCPRCGKPFVFSNRNWFYDKTKSKEHPLMYCPYCDFLMFVPIIYTES